jgi:hypothetical protein
MKQKFYHSSPCRFRHGDILTGNRRGGYGSHSNVCMTTSPEPHATIAHRIPGWINYWPFTCDCDDPNCSSKHQCDPTLDWFVYEVEPLYDPTYVSWTCEYQTRAARVIRNLGKAKNFLNKNHKPSYPREGWLEKRLAEKRAKRSARKIKDEPL